MLLRSLILTGAINGLFFILLLMKKPKSTDSDKLLMLWMAIIALQLLFYYDNLSANPVLPVYLQLMCFPLPLISSPVFYFYIYSLSLGYSLKSTGRLLHLFPYLVFILVIFFLYFTRPDSLFFKDGVPHFSGDVNNNIIYSLTGLLAIVPGYYTIASFFVLMKYQKMLPDNYSYTEKINLNWLKWIVISLLILFIGLFLFIKFGVNYGLVSYPKLFAVVGSVITGYVFFIGFCGLNQTMVVSGQPVEESLVEKDITERYKNSGLNDQKIDGIFLLLTSYMDEYKPFLQDDLSLSALAQQLELTSNQLSQVINQKSNVNFFNFVNTYRVEAVKEKLRDPKMAHFSILGIAYDCGFRSKSSFNKIFKDATGQTPLQYQKAAI